MRAAGARGDHLIRATALGLNFGPLRPTHRAWPAPRGSTLGNMEDTPSQGASLGRKAIAALVLLIAAYILLKVVIGLITAIALPVLAIFAVIAIVWALNTIL